MICRQRPGIIATHTHADLEINYIGTLITYLMVYMILVVIIIIIKEGKKERKKEKDLLDPNFDEESSLNEEQ